MFIKFTIACGIGIFKKLCKLAFFSKIINGKSEKAV
jgi:hypothetical protein